MTYFRLRDIKTPPFAYVLNKDAVIQDCPRCNMPFNRLEKTLEIEICVADSRNWEQFLAGRPLMADHWLVGDAQCAAHFERLAPGQFRCQPVKVMNWLTRNAPENLGQIGDLLKARRHSAPPEYYYLQPINQINLDPKLRESFPPMRCGECRREIPDLPIDFQPIPDPSQPLYPIASLRDLHLEGYDYLFHEEIAQKIEDQFPEMLMERLIWEPLPF